MHDERGGDHGHEPVHERNAEQERNHDPCDEHPLSVTASHLSRAPLVETPQRRQLEVFPYQKIPI